MMEHSEVEEGINSGYFGWIPPSSEGKRTLEKRMRILSIIRDTSLSVKCRT